MVDARPASRAGRWTLVALLTAPAAFFAMGLGVAGGAYLHDTGRALVGEAEYFWFWVFLLVSAGLAVPRRTRRLAAMPLSVYLVVLALAYWSGHTWGNFIGWHPD